MNIFTLTVRKSTLVVRIWSLQTSDSDDQSNCWSPRCKLGLMLFIRTTVQNLLFYNRNAMQRRKTATVHFTIISCCPLLFHASVWDTSTTHMQLHQVTWNETLTIPRQYWWTQQFGLQVLCGCFSGFYDGAWFSVCLHCWRLWQDFIPQPPTAIHSTYPYVQCAAKANCSNCSLE